MTPLKPIGDAERETLVALIAVREWGPGDRPLWGNNKYWTAQLLNSLARKGHVTDTSDGVYRPSDEGLAEIIAGPFHLGDSFGIH